MLRVIIPSGNVLGDSMLNVNMLIAIMLRVKVHWDDFHCAKCKYAKCHYTMCHYDYCHYTGYHYGECHYAECHYAFCH